jgi:acetyl esterase
LRAFARLYADDPQDPRVSPLLGDRFDRLPPTVVVTAEHDPLRDEGELFARRVTDAGGTAHVRRWDRMVHGFPGMTAELSEADEALQWAADRLRALLP